MQEVKPISISTELGGLVCTHQGATPDLPFGPRFPSKFLYLTITKLLLHRLLLYTFSYSRSSKYGQWKLEEWQECCRARMLFSCSGKMWQKIQNWKSWWFCHSWKAENGPQRNCCGATAMTHRFSLILLETWWLFTLTNCSPTIDEEYFFSDDSVGSWQDLVQWYMVGSFMTITQDHTDQPSCVMMLNQASWEAVSFFKFAADNWCTCPLQIIFSTMTQLTNCVGKMITDDHIRVERIKNRMDRNYNGLSSNGYDLPEWHAKMAWCLLKWHAKMAWCLLKWHAKMAWCLLKWLGVC